MAQVVIGAAGYDGRAFRYAKPGVTWFELDHPSTQADKMARLGKLGVQTGHVRFVAADFASDPVAQQAARRRPRTRGRRRCSCSRGWPYTSSQEFSSGMLRQLREVAADREPAHDQRVDHRSHDPVAQGQVPGRGGFDGGAGSLDDGVDEAGNLLASTGWELVAGDGPDPEAGDEPGE